MAKLGTIGEVVPRGGRAVFTAYNKKIADDIGQKLASPRRGAMRWSPQQEYIYDWVQTPQGGNAVIEAVAGAGKTTTLVEVCHLLNMQVSSATFHSIGLRAWQTVARPRVKGEKIEDLMEEEDVPRHLRAFVGKLVSLAKQRGIGTSLYVEATPLSSSDLRISTIEQPWLEIIDHFNLDEILPEFCTLGEGIEIARSVLRASIHQAEEVIDFEDMIYMPLQAQVAIPQYDWVLVDELQDTNPTRRELARRMLSPSGRFIGVGDPHQAIYGFTGADNDAMEIVKQQFQCITLPLTVTYRCPKAVVRHAQQWVSHIQAHESAPEGAVRNITLKTFNKVLDWTAINKGPQLPTTNGIGVLRTEDAILCRNTRPLIETAFDMIRRRIPCHVEGRDIGQGLISLVKKWKTVRTVYQLRDRLEEYLDTETRKLLKRGRRDKVASLEDKVGTLMVFMASLHDDDSTFKLIDSINSLFKDTETGKKAATVTLSTVHKSKGREWPRVYLLGRNVFMPSAYAKQDWELEQEDNLIYVAVTRAKQELIEVQYPLPGTDGSPRALKFNPPHAAPYGGMNGRIEMLFCPGCGREHEAPECNLGTTYPDNSEEDREAERWNDALHAMGYYEDEGEERAKSSDSHSAMESRPALRSGRLSSSAPAMQSIRYPEKYRAIQEIAEAAQEGGMSADESEGRLLAWLAEQDQLRAGGMTNLSEEG